MAILIPPAPIIADNAKALQAAQQDAIHHCKQKFAGQDYTNIPTGATIKVSAKGIRHSLHAAQPRLIRAMYVLPEVLSNAELTGLVPDKHGRPDILGVHKYELEVLDGNQLLLALLVAFDHRGHGQIFYDLAFLAR